MAQSEEPCGQGDTGLWLKLVYNLFVVEDKKIDAIVVGAGPCGIASAIVIARAGKKAVVLERGSFFGSKNMFGGAVFLQSIKELFPTTWQEAPYEAFITEHLYSLLSDNASVDISYKSTKEPNMATVFRPKFDDWLVGQAKKEGVFFAPETLVRELIVENDKVVGVRTELEDFLAPLVIIAEGSHSNLAQQIGLKKPLKPENLVLGVKETLKLDSAVIRERFGLNEGESTVYQFFGGIAQNPQPLAMGFLYTFKNHISIGIGANLKDLANLKIKPYELLENLKAHKSVAKLIKDATAIEYSAHTIPEGGYYDLAKFYTDGALVAGDAAGFVNNIYYEGTNLAIKSGILAGETAIEAINAGKFDKKTLSAYEKKLKKSFIIKDLKGHRNVMKALHKSSDFVFDFTPKKAAEFFEVFTAASGVPKSATYKKFILSIFKDRNPGKLLKDFFRFAKCLLEVLK